MPSPTALPAIITPALLSSLRARPNLPIGTWYFITGVALSALNRPDEIPRVFEYALEKGAEHPPPPTGKGRGSEVEKEGGSPIVDPDERLRVARRMREALVKSSAIVGLPKTINALLALKRATPASLLDPPLSYTPSHRSIDLSSTPPPQILARGSKLFSTIYGKITARVMGQMDNSGTEDLGLTARLIYGYVLSGGDRILTPLETSCVLLAGLVPQDVNPQLKGHLKGMVNNGATVDEVRAVRGAVLDLCYAAGMRGLKDGTLHGWGWTEEVANL